MIRVLLVDDEPLSSRGLELVLERETGIEIVGTATNGDDALRLITTLQPDLVFLDIQLPGLSGLQVASAIHCVPFVEVIFVTAFEQYALEAFTVDAVDYLLKPIQPERVLQSLQRAKRRRSGVRTDRDRSDLTSTAALLHFPDRHGGFDISQSEIIWVEAEKDYALVHTEKRSFILRTTMIALSKQLQPPLVRVHRSAYVSLDRVCRLLPSSKGVFSVVLADDTKVQVGPSYSRVVRAMLRHRNSDGERRESLAP